MTRKRDSEARGAFGRRARVLCLLLCVLMLLSGCSGSQNTITIIEAPEGYDPFAPVETVAPTATPAAAAEDEVVPAPATVDDMRAAASQSMLDEDYEQASIYTTIASGDLNVGLVVGDNMDINPLKCTYTDMMNLNTLVYEGLVALDEQQQIVPQLADRWVLENDTWVFTLRSGIYFHNGSLLSAADVVASYEALKGTGTYWTNLLSVVESMTARDENTVEVVGKAGYMTLYALTFPVVQRNTVSSAMPSGTGPYWITQYDTSTAVRLEANPLWWKRGSGKINSIVGLCYGSLSSALAALETGEIDALASEYPTASINRNLSDRMSVDYSTLTYECIVPNLTDSILSDHSVREALMYAIDRSTLASTVYTGMVQESEVPVVPGTYLYDAQAARYNYSPERALQILYDAGWSDPDSDGILSKEVDGIITPLALTLVTYDRGTTSTRSEAVEAIANQLRLVGFDITVSTDTIGSVYDALDNGKFDLALVAFELSDVPNLAFLFSSTGSFNFSRYKDDEMDSLLQAAYRATSAADLRSAMSKIQIKIVEDLPILGLFFRTGVLVSKKSLGTQAGLRRGWVLNGVATADAE